VPWEEPFTATWIGILKARVSGVYSMIPFAQTEAPQVHPGPSDLPLGKVEWFLLGLLVSAAFAIRVYNLGGLPDTVLGDEADNTQSAVRILYNLPPANGFFGFDWAPQPALSAYKQAAFLAIFGFNIMALRLPSAVMSTLALIPFYMLLRRQFSVVSAFLATILLATNVWYLNFSRSGWNCGDICFYMLAAMLFLVLALNAMTSASGPLWLKWFHFGAAGFFCALGLYGYPSGRAITLATLAFLPVALLMYRTYRKTLLMGYVLLFVVEVVAFAPQAAYIARNWESFNLRVRVVVILNDPAFKADPIGTMLRQLDRNIRGPWDGRVNNTAQYSPVGEPQLEKITGLLVLAGMTLTFVVGRLRGQPETWLWWLMLLAGWGLTQLPTVGTPNGARGVGYMPTLIYFTAVSFEGILAVLRLIPVRAGWVLVARRLPVAALVVAILLTGYANVKHYIEWQNMPRTRQDRYLYITAREFPLWAADVVDRAKNNRGISNVEGWRSDHPIQNIADPYNATPSH
jgi:4-amino-4-deoxy-L-arabinose transferase-like glycosyltransferase